jgi:hypothetical protein
MPYANTGTGSGAELSNAIKKSIFASGHAVESAVLAMGVTGAVLTVVLADIGVNTPSTTTYAYTIPFATPTNDGIVTAADYVRLLEAARRIIPPTYDPADVQTRLWYFNTAEIIQPLAALSAGTYAGNVIETTDGKVVGVWQNDGDSTAYFGIGTESGGVITPEIVFADSVGGWALSEYDMSGYTFVANNYDFSFVNMADDNTLPTYTAIEYGIEQDLVDVKTELMSITEKVVNKTTSLTEASTHTGYPTAKAVYDFVLARGLAFFNYKQVDGLELVDRDMGGVDPFDVTDVVADFDSGAAEGDIALALNDSMTVNVYEMVSGAWVLQGTAAVDEGNLFHSVSDGHGWYWFAGTWNLLDAEVDLTPYYTKTEIDTILEDVGKVDTVQGITPDALKNVKLIYEFADEAARLADWDNVPVGAMVTLPTDEDDAAPVMTIEGLEADAEHNVKLTYIYDTQEQWENGDVGLPPWYELPIGANAIKAFLYKDNAYHTLASPDYANIESINHIPDGGGSWTADRDGYVWCFGRGNSATSYYVMVTVNGIEVWRSHGYTNTNVNASTTIPVAKGDVVNVSGGNYTIVSAGCYFVPPKYKAVPAAVSVIEPGGDYSLDEKPVLVWDEGVVRQKLDVDGSPIWEQTFAGSIPATPAITYVGIPLRSGVKAVVNIAGWWNPSANIRQPITSQNTHKILTQGATVTRPAMAAATGTSMAITFPIPFQEVPVITVEDQSGGAGWNLVGQRITPSTSGFTVYWHNAATVTNTATAMYWRAIGKQYVRQHIPQVAWTDAGDVSIQAFDYIAMDGTGTYQVTLQYTKL